MKSNSKSSDIDDLNTVVLKEEELFRVIDDYRTVRDIGACPGVTGRLAESRLHQENPERAEAILARLHALSRMIENEDLKSWLPVDGICVMPSIANKALISAAAKHPLSIINGGITFERESFLRRILESAETEGSSKN